MAGCSNQQTTIDAIEGRVASLREHTRKTPQRGLITWDEASAMLLQKNPQLLRARNHRERAEKERSGYWKNYVPGIRGSASFGQRIGELEDLKLSDFNVYAFLNLRLPNPITIRGELYALGLSEYRSGRAYELAKRRQLAALYREFVYYQQLEKEHQEALTTDSGASKIADASDMIMKIQKAANQSLRLENLRKSMDQTSFRLSQMLQLTDYRVRPSPKRLPGTDYSKRYRDLGKDEDYGRLALQILAADLEAARLRHQRVRLGNWPSINFGATAPQLYSSNSDSYDNFEVESIRLYAGLTKGFNISGKMNERVEISQKEYEQIVSDAYYRVIRERENLRRTLDQYSRLQAKKRSLQSALQLNRELMKTNLSPDSIVSAMEKQAQLTQHLKSVNKSITNQELEFWIWDEDVWK